MLLLPIACAPSATRAALPPNPLGIVTNASKGAVGEPSPLSFPADDAAHPGNFIEWWQWWLHFKTSDGHRYGATVTFFAFPISSALTGAGLGIRRTDVRFTDLSARSPYYASKYGTDPVANVADGFALKAAGQQANGGDGHDRLHLAVGGYTLDVRASTTKPPIPYANSAGFVRIDPLETAQVYERWRMSLSGTLLGRGRHVRVSGTAWSEHGWGNIPSVAAIEWDFFQLQLADGRDMLVARVKHIGGIPAFLYVGAIRDKHGTITYLHQGDFRIQPTGAWRRDATCTYPSGWNITIRAQRFTMTPSVRDQEIRSFYGNLWDGETDISGAGRGVGIAELLNYCYLPQPLELLH
jgi:predicted secreted hydrolase